MKNCHFPIIIHIVDACSIFSKLSSRNLHTRRYRSSSSSSSNVCCWSYQPHSQAHSGDTTCELNICACIGGCRINTSTDNNSELSLSRCAVRYYEKYFPSGHFCCCCFRCWCLFVNWVPCVMCMCVHMFFFSLPACGVCACLFVWSKDTTHAFSTDYLFYFRTIQAVKKSCITAIVLQARRMCVWYITRMLLLLSLSFILFCLSTSISQQLW